MNKKYRIMAYSKTGRLLARRCAPDHHHVVITRADILSQWPDATVTVLVRDGNYKIGNLVGENYRIDKEENIQ